ncbi:MAG: efflux RND transporter permease subunit, partial [Acetobacteraceae bacterium]
NQFDYKSHVFYVMIQDEARFRSRLSDISQLHVRSTSGAMVPLSSLVTTSTVQGANAITRYDLYPAVAINGSAGPGKSSAQAMAAMAQIAQKHLPEGFAYDWTGMSYQERQSVGQTMYAFTFAIVFSYLFLVAQYESWTLPLSVLLSVSTAILGGLLFLWLRGIALNIYAQIGLVLMIGLAAKNAILIVEFAKMRLEAGEDVRQAGEDVRQAAEDGARTRYRAVMMTALAFIFGVIPLVIASGAGSGARRSIGTTVFGGMILAAIVGVLLVPVLFVAFEYTTQASSRFWRRIGQRRQRGD